MGSLGGTVLVLFVGFFVLYLWQFKYGTSETIAKNEAELQSTRFTAATAADEAAPVTPPSLIPYIHATNPTLGSKTSKVTIVAFIDFECPFCQQSYPVFKQVAQKYGPAIQVVFKHLPLTGIHPQAFAAANAASCAAEQNKFWEYYDALFINKNLETSALFAHAETLKLNSEQFTTCFNSEKYRKNIEVDIEDAIALGVRGTPTYFTNKTVVEGAIDATQWDTIILDNLK